MTATNISWTDRVWNPTTGCDRVSPGCDHCYAAVMANRLKAAGQDRYQVDGDPRTSGPGFALQMHPSQVVVPFSWSTRTPARCFVNSMSDLFHPRVSDAFLAEVWAVMLLTPHVTYQVLTKRPARMRSLLGSSAFRALVVEAMRGFAARYRRPVPAPMWPGLNIQLGVSVENQEQAERRIPDLVATFAWTRFISAEPLLGPVDLTEWTCTLPAVPGHNCTVSRHALGWVIIGGESGGGARPMDLEWARALLLQSTGVRRVFVKQLGAVWARTTEATPGRPVASYDRSGTDPAWWPADLQIQEHPLLVKMLPEPSDLEYEAEVWL